MTQLTDKIYAIKVSDNINNFKSFTKAVKNEAADVPLGRCQFLFTTKTATEEDARKVVRSSDWHFPDKHIRFVDYKHPYDRENKQRWGEGFGTALESLASLLHSKNCDPNKNYALIERQSSHGAE